MQREDLNAVDEAQAFQQLMDFGLNQEEVGKAVGKSRSAVANTLRLLKLPAEALKALSQNKISAGHARAILAQPDEDKAWAFEQIVAQDLNVREAEGLKRNAAGTKRGKSASDGRYIELEHDISRHVGSRVKIKGGSKGKMELHFHSTDELERLLELLGYQA